ncbi:hypothetical protein NDU88_005811 [Pleurodeles waltl]|uniref:Uncharacterized protein n=1 Tax=Pleurodeles waltl TaxID=8319 RepID=A0AAV7TVU6_PLEWA|nr:hypothetical protein NDU88_005811 [Pleurodeles waltl]
MPRTKRSRSRRDRTRNTTRTGPNKCAPDLEQQIQERREAIHTEAAMGMPPPGLGSDTKISQQTNRPEAVPPHQIVYQNWALLMGLLQHQPPQTKKFKKTLEQSKEPKHCKKNPTRDAYTNYLTKRATTP